VKIVITGGSSGIGKHLAKTCLERGDDVTIVAEDRAKVDAAAAELAGSAPRVRGITCDVGDRHAVEAMVAEVLSTAGCPDVLVNNAGFAVYRSFEQSTMEEIERLVDVNLLGAMRCIRGFLPAMMERRAGHIVNVASIAGLMPITPCAAYGAAKHGMVGISETLRFELRDFGVKVHLVCPGRVETPFFHHETFRSRAPRRETRNALPIEAVSWAILDAVEKGRFMTVVPRTLGLAAWARSVVPWLADAVLGRILVSRVRAVRSLDSNGQLRR